MTQNWDPDTWRSKPAKQLPDYPDTAKLEAAEKTLSTLPPLVFAGEARNPESRGTYIPKSAKGVRDMVSVLKNNGRLGQLIDQKYNRGIAAEFFGRPAMTSPAFAQLAKKFDCPILPFRVERLSGPHFRIHLYPLIHVNGRSEEEIVREAHTMLEDWIKEHPGQWLWLHRRWDSKTLKPANNPASPHKLAPEHCRKPF